MAKATITTQTGSTIIVEGSEKDVASIISRIELPEREENKYRTEVQKTKKRDSASDLVKGLKEEKFFDEPRSLGDVVGALSEKGYAYPSTTLSGVMISLVKGKIIGRKNLNGKWVYGK